jgi:hypothetical protein
MNTLGKGGVGLARAIYEYQKLGYNVSIPLIDAQDYDLVIEKNEKFYSVQCRYTSQRARLGDGEFSEERFEVGLRTIKTNTKKTVTKKRGVYDLLFVLCKNDDCYSIPASELPMSGTTVGGLKYAKYKLEARQMCGVAAALC